MLTGYQCEVVAYWLADIGEYVCADCAAEAWGSLGVEQADVGLHHTLTPVIRFSLDESNSERVYEAAEDEYYTRVERGDLKDDEREKWAIIDAIAEEIDDQYAEQCGRCDRVLD